MKLGTEVSFGSTYAAALERAGGKERERKPMCSATSFPTMALNFGDCPFSTVQFQLNPIVARWAEKRSKNRWKQQFR